MIANMGQLWVFFFSPAPMCLNVKENVKCERKDS